MISWTDLWSGTPSETTNKGVLLLKRKKTQDQKLAVSA